MILNTYGDPGESRVIYRLIQAAEDGRVTAKLMDEVGAPHGVSRVELTLTTSEALAWARGLIEAVEVDRRAGDRVNVRIGPLCGFLGGDLCWGRFYGRGIIVKRTAPLFSERYGHKRPFARLGPWRAFWLRSWGDTGA